MRKLMYAGFLLLMSVFAFAEEGGGSDDIEVLSMFYPESDLIVTPTRAPKRISQVAENVAVITAKDIEEINAHTLTDVLRTVPGIQIDMFGASWSPAFVYIQQSDFRQVLLLIDGVPQNNITDGFPDISALPVQNIERIEIIKGPGSAAWGSSLGGVINIITKGPAEGKRATGVVSSSFGERATADHRGEASGTINNFGYYLYGGKLRSDGLIPNTETDKDSAFAKLQWDPNNRASLRLSFGYDGGPRGEGIRPYGSFDSDLAYGYTSLTFDYAVSERTDVSLLLWGTRRDVDLLMQTPSFSLSSNVEEKRYGSALKLIHRRGINQFLLGADVDHGNVDVNIFPTEQVSEKWGIYANDSLVIGNFSITPGVRYDYTDTNGDFLTPSLGATYQLKNNTVLRAYAARGFNVPPTGFRLRASEKLKVERVWTYQAGIETTAFNCLWLKTTLFHHDLADVLSALPGGKVATQSDLRRQGAEVEVKSIPVFDTALSAGFMIVNLEGEDGGEVYDDVIRYSYDVGVHYDNAKVARAALIGHYVSWNDKNDQGRYNFIWDLAASRKIYAMGDTSHFEAFFNIHNIFDSAHYHYDYVPSPRRWVEGGLRLKF